MKKINFKKIKKDSEKKKMEAPIKKEKKVKKHRKRRFRFFYWLLVLMVLFAIAVFVGGVGFCYYIVKSAPEYNIEKMFEKEPSRLFDSKGNLFATLGTEQREKVTYDQLPQVLIDAIIATEDSRFFQHNGFDAPRFLKASISQVLGKGGGGASTLTMQLSKLAFTSTEASGIEGIVRKFRDIYMSVFKMEKNLTKEEIFEYYINNPCLGGNIYGVSAASKYYFNKDVGDLNLVEAAQIAGMFQSPNGYNPYVYPEDANDRKNTVLYLMKRHGYITDEQYEAGISVQIKDFLDVGTTATNQYQGFIDTVVQEVIDDTENNPYEVPMDIYTTMVSKKQDAINKFYKNHKFKDKKVEVGVGVIDNKTGAVIAVGAGRYKTSAMTLNVATFHGQIKRQPGSTIKPIIDYGPAIEYTNLSTYGPFINDETPYGGGMIKNFNNSYSGFMTMKECLQRSMNTCALQAFRLTTNEQKIEFGLKLGIDYINDILPDGKTELPDSYSIGAFNGVSPIQLASAYSAFGNNGKRYTPHTYTKLIYRETDEVVKKDIVSEQVMKPTTAYIIANILTGATSYRVKVSGTQVATKTGTTSYDYSQLKKYGLNDSVIPDMWTAGFTKDYSMSIWYGYTESLSKENVKKKYYLVNSPSITERITIQAELSKAIYEKNTTFSKPAGLTSAKVELETIPAQKPSAYTPDKLIGTFMFVGNTGPSEVSPRFDKLTDPSNVTYSFGTNAINLSWASPGIPSAIDKNYLTDYFNNNWKIKPEKYLKKRLSYNTSNIGDFGFAIYLTSGTNSTYVGWTKDTSYTIDTKQFAGIYDGVIVKSMYSKFKKNASNGYKVVFDYAPSGESVDPAKINVVMSNLNLTLSKNATFTELNNNSVTSITYDNFEIKPKVTNLSVITSTITKNGQTVNVSPNDLTSSTGTYNITYSVSFIYNGASITKLITQTVIVQ